jgi:phosphoglycolate phosphatase
VLIVTAKYGVSARLALQAAGLVADEVVGDLFAEDKASALLEHDAWVYVGDHPGDVRAARTAGVHAVVVATGPTSVEALHAAGPDVVLPDLTHLPAWLASA